MKAADQNGIPCCFVIGRDRKIAYIGHPMYLDVVLPKVVAGTWKAEDAAALEKVGEEVNNVFKSFGGDAEDRPQDSRRVREEPPEARRYPVLQRAEARTC